MEKKFTKFTVAAMKRTAANVDQFISKRNRLMAKIQALDTELNVIKEAIKAADAPTIAMTGGYGSEDLFKKVVTDTGKVDKNGNAIKTVKFVLRYPDTVIPPADCACGCPDTYIGLEDCDEGGVVPEVIE